MSRRPRCFNLFLIRGNMASTSLVSRRGGQICNERDFREGKSASDLNVHSLPMAESAPPTRGSDLEIIRSRPFLEPTH